MLLHGHGTIFEKIEEKSGHSAFLFFSSGEMNTCFPFPPGKAQGLRCKRIDCKVFRRLKSHFRFEYSATIVSGSVLA
jgi:hypothetical protein